MQEPPNSLPLSEQQPSSESSRQWVHSLPPEEQSQLAEALTPRWNKYLERIRTIRGLGDSGEWRFPSLTQHAFLLVDWVEDVLFGGAAGGGKSEVLLAAALQYVDVPGYAAILFRRSFMDLAKPDALIPRASEVLSGTDAHWKGDTREWVFPTGATISFGYLQSSGDRENWQGAAAQYWGFDEAGQLNPEDMEYLKSRARRRVGVNVPVRFRYSANPGGRAHEWLVENFVAGAPENGKVFIPSKAVDNPGLDHADYSRRMGGIGNDVLRAQLRDGDWGAVDRSGLICPEWTPDTEAECTRHDDSVPACFTGYAGADPGGHSREAARDLFGMLWGHLDFIRGVLVITDEWAARNPATVDVGTAAVAAELTRFGPRGNGWPEWTPQHIREHRYSKQIDAVLRVTDLDGRLVNDLKAPPYNLSFVHTEKTEATEWERRLRTAIRQRRVEVHARCTRLLKTLKYGRWNDNRTDYERTEETGHADLWKCLIYIFRNVQWQRNPFPPRDITRAEQALGVKPPYHSTAARAMQGGFKGAKPLR